jgi:hypothetical protein
MLLQSYTPAQSPSTAMLAEQAGMLLSAWQMGRLVPSYPTLSHATPPPPPLP